MAHFAKIENNKVIEVAVVENAVIRNISGDEQESLGQDFLRKIKNEPNAVWLQCSYNQKIRNVFPSPQWDYNPSEDKFYPPSPYPSWVWNEEIKSWLSPIGEPTDESKTTWNEDNGEWQ